MPDQAIKSAFAARLRKLIKETGLKQFQFVALVQEQMPEHVRFERGLLASYIAGKNLPWPIVFHALCRALKVTPDDLMPSTDDKVSHPG